MLTCLYQKTVTLRFFVKICERTLNPLLLRKLFCTVICNRTNYRGILIRQLHLLPFLVCLKTPFSTNLYPIETSQINCPTNQ